MVTKSKLKMALMADKGVDINKQKEKKKQKAARKEKARKERRKVGEPDDWEDLSEDDEDGGAPITNGEARDEEEEAVNPTEIDFEGLNDSDSSSSASEPDDAEEDPEDIPISDLEDLSDTEKEDIIPHQRLTINNTSALTSALKRIALPISTLPFSDHQSLVSASTVPIPDVSDDLNRELAFYSQSLSSVQEARQLFKKEGTPFSRPKDYFAEMVKADEHMEKIKARLIDEAASKKASAEARKQRDLKKFGKQVQVAKTQEREREKRSVLDKIKVLKRKRQDTNNDTTNEADLFDVALEEETKPASRRDRTQPNKRQKKDEKFGFGGKKRFGKSGDAVSSGDLRGFSSRKMKGGVGGKGQKQRLGKARRAGAKR